MVKKSIGLCLVLCVLGVFSQPLMAEEEDYSNEPWERAALYLGAFFVHADSDLELGEGAGINIDGSDDFLSEIDLNNGGVLAFAKLYF